MRIFGTLVKMPSYIRAQTTSENRGCKVKNLNLNFVYVAMGFQYRCKSSYSRDIYIMYKYKNIL